MFGIQLKGIVEYKLRDDETGEVVREGRQENLFTTAGKRMNFWQMQPQSGQYILWIGNDSRTIPADGSSMVRADPVSSINDTEQNVGFTWTGWNFDTLTRVVSEAFPAPSGGSRTTTHVGWKLYGPGATPTNGRHELPYTALEISPPIVQSTIQTLEITYTIVMVLPKSITGLQRFKAIGDAAALRRLRYRYTYITPVGGGGVRLTPCTLPRYWFVDEGSYLLGQGQDQDSAWFNASWNGVVPALTTPSLSFPGVAVRGGTVVENVSEGNGNAPGSRNGAFGMATIYDNTSSVWPNDQASETTLVQHEAWSFWPFCFEEGVVGPDVFPQPSRTGQGGTGSTSYLFNQTGVDKSGQGELEIQGPYQPSSVDPGAPTHWAYRVMNTKDGSVVGAGTEGGYIFQRKNWYSYPWGPQPDVGEIPPNPNTDLVDRAQADSTWGMSGLEQRMFLLERNNAAQGTDNPRCIARLVYDGIDTFWGLGWRDGDGGGGDHTLFRWRGHTHENIFKGVNNPNLSPLGETGDDAQTDFRFVDQDGNQIGASPSFPYAFTSDGAGLVFYGHRTAGNNTGAANPIFTIDNTQPGRWKQRVSGSADGVDADRFVVDAADEVHDMFPFIGGDVGKRLRITDGANAGVYQVATFVDSNNVDLYESDGITPATLSADSEMTWHWCKVTKRTNHGVGELSTLAYDQANGRLWAIGALGVQVSVDDGATWSALVDENGGSIPQFPDAGPRTNVQVGRADGLATTTPWAIDANGDFYWISNSTEYWVNKLSWNTTGPGGDGTFSRLGLTTNFPGTNKPPGINQLVFDIGCDNSNGLGAIWVHGDVALVGAPYTQSFFRLTVVAGALSAVNLTEYDPTVLTNMPRHPGWIGVTPGGMSVMATTELYMRPRYMFVPRALGGGLNAAFFDMGASGNPIFGPSGIGYGPLAFRPDGTFLTTTDRNGKNGVFGSFWNNYFWNDLTSEWLPWEGDGTQFDAFYGTTNGGVKVPHTGFEELLDNVQVKFTPAGGGTADTDEFKEGESFVFLATFGPHRTNVEDFSVSSHHSEMGGTYEIESEAVKTVAANTRPVQVFWNRSVLDPAVGSFKNVTGDTPIQDANTKLWGWEPNRTQRMEGVGDSPNEGTSTTGGDFQATLDLGAAPPEIGKIRLMVSTDQNTTNERDYIHFLASQANTLWFGASDDGTFTDGVFTGPSNEYDAPNQRWDNVNEVFPEGFNIEECANYQLTNIFSTQYVGWLIEIDLVAIGMTAGERTHRYWQMVYNRLTNGRPIDIYWMEALDPSGNRIGMTANMRVDEADTDPEFAGVLIDEAHWIQDEPNQAPNNPTTVSTAGTPSNFTNFVTVDAGTFNTAKIDITTDYLAWEEPGNTAAGFLRDAGNRDSDLVRGKMGVVNDVHDRTSKQAMSKITAVTATTITVRDSIIPDNLAAAAWEVRRPIYDGTDYSGRPSVGLNAVAQATNLNGMGYCPYEGYFNHNEDNETNARKFRVTRKTVFKIV